MMRSIDREAEELIGCWLKDCTEEERTDVRATLNAHMEKLLDEGSDKYGAYNIASQLLHALTYGISGPGTHDL